MAKAELRDKRIIIETEYRERDLIRAVPGAKWSNAEKVWSMPFSWVNCKMLRAVFGERLEVGPELEVVAWREYERVQDVMRVRATAMDVSRMLATGGGLYPYQEAGVSFLQRAGSAILADEMGTGKTVQTMTAIEEMDAYPALIVCPNGVKRTWAEEYAKWLPHVSVTVVGGSAAKRRKQLDELTQVHIVNWEALRYHSRLAPYGSIRLSDKEKEEGELNRAWGTVVADEAHRAKDPKAKQTRALWAVGAWARHRYALTGTPIANNPVDLWALLHFVAPDEWPARTKYIDMFCLTSFNPFGGLEVRGIKPDTAPLFFEVVDTRFLRRPKSLVLPQLPPKVWLTRYVDMTPTQAKAYKQLEAESIADVPGGTILSFDGLTDNTRLTQFASASCRLDENDQVVMEHPSSKVSALLELLEEMGDDPLVVFAASRQLIDLACEKLEAAGIKHGRITGSESELVRDVAKQDFMEGNTRVLLLTLGAGAEGLTLTRAATICFMQRSWSLVENKQAEDRIHRPGQEADHVTILDFVAPATVEEHIVEALRGKADMAEEINRDQEVAWTA